MRKAMMILTASVLCIPALAACSGDSESTSTVTVTSAAGEHNPPAFDEPTDDDGTDGRGMVSVDPEEEESEETENTTIDEDIADLALEITWDGMTSTEQDTICDGWALDRSGMADIFMETAGDTFTRSDVLYFFDTECAV